MLSKNSIINKKETHIISSLSQFKYDIEKIKNYNKLEIIVKYLFKILNFIFLILH